MPHKYLNKNLIWPILMTLIVGISGFSSQFNSYAEQSVDSALKRAVVTFGVARGLNAIISAAQETEVSVTPMGMGITLTPGEVLDPLNDLVERFSSFMLVSSVALGVQKNLLAITGWLPYSLALVSIGVSFTIYRAVSPGATRGWGHYAWKVFVLLVVFRFLVPFAVIGSEWMYAGFLQTEHDRAELGITSASQQVQLINKERDAFTEHQSESSTWEHVKQWAEGAKQKATAVVDVKRYSHALKETAHDVIQLIVVFCLCTFIFPVVIAIGIWKLTKWTLVGRHV